MTTLNDIAPWPASEDEVSAEALARAVAVRAHGLREWAKANVADSHMHSLAVSSAASALGVVDALTTTGDKSAANARARWLWRAWRDDETADELHHLLTGFGIDPEQVAKVARDEP
jgi:hypothetical protein